MNKTPSEAEALAEMLLPLVNTKDTDVVFCVPSIDIIPVGNIIKNTNTQNDMMRKINIYPQIIYRSVLRYFLRKIICIPQHFMIIIIFSSVFSVNRF